MQPSLIKWTLAFTRARDHEISALTRSDNGAMNGLLHNRRKFHLYGMAICLFAVAIADCLSAQSLRRAWFNGKDRDSRQQVGPGSLVVQDGTRKTEGGMGMLWYAREKISYERIFGVRRRAGAVELRTTRSVPNV